MPQINTRWSVRILMLLGLVLGLSVWVMAQASLTCPELVEEALIDLSENCSLLDRNEACYGYRRVGATFREEVAEDFFSRAGDQVELVRVDTLETAPYNLREQEWGVALLSVQADLPNTLPGENVKMIVMGDVQLENAVPDEDAFTSEASVPLALTDAGAFRSRPTNRANVVGRAPANSRVMADAITANGSWVRAAYTSEETGGWLPRETFVPADQLGRLPIKQPDAQSPMQAFYFSTGIGVARCTEAPTSLVVQGPEGLEIDINANGAGVRITSTGFFRTGFNGTEQVMLVGALNGTLYLFPDTPEEIMIPTGFVAEVCVRTRTLDEAGVDENADATGRRPILTLDPTCPLPVPRPFTQAELDDLRTLERIDPALLSYPIRLPDGVTPVIVRPFPTPTPAPVCAAADWPYSYTVQVNDALERIARWHGSSVDEMARGNCLPDPDLIRTGEILRVPNPLLPPPAPVVVVAVVDVPAPAPPDPAPVDSAPAAPTPADLAVTVAANPPGALVHEGEAYNLTISVQNLSSETASGIVVNLTDPGVIPALQFLGVTGAGYDALSDTLTIATLAGGASGTVTLQLGVVPGSAGAAVPFTATLASTATGDTNTGNNAAAIPKTIDYYSTTMTVNSLAQLVAADGLCTLPEALQNANNNNAVAGAIWGDCPAGRPAALVDGIALAAGTYPTVNLTITDALTLSGAGVATILEDTTGVPALTVNTPGDVTLSDMTIQNSGAGVPAVNAGGVSVTAANSVTLNNMTFNANNGWLAGGVYAAGAAQLTINAVTFINNAAASTGGAGAIHSASVPMTVTNATFTNNTGAVFQMIFALGPATWVGTGNTITPGHPVPLCNLAAANAGGFTGDDGTCD